MVCVNVIQGGTEIEHIRQELQLSESHRPRQTPSVSELPTYLPNIAIPLTIPMIGFCESHTKKKSEVCRLRDNERPKVLEE